MGEVRREPVASFCGEASGEDCSSSESFVD